MVNKLVLGGVLLIMLSAGFVFMSWDSSEEDSKISSNDYYYSEVNYMEEKIYEGPVPQGYDLEHFRKTGETIKEVNN